jgi:hypothetical protein
MAIVKKTTTVVAKSAAKPMMKRSPIVAKSTTMEKIGGADWKKDSTNYMKSKAVLDSNSYRSIAKKPVLKGARIEAAKKTVKDIANKYEINKTKRNQLYEAGVKADNKLGESKFVSKKLGLKLPVDFYGTDYPKMPKSKKNK